MATTNSTVATIASATVTSAGTTTAEATNALAASASSTATVSAATISRPTKRHKRPRNYAKVAAVDDLNAHALILDVDVLYDRAMAGCGRETAESKPVEVAFADGSSVMASVSRAVVFLLGTKNHSIAHECIFLRRR